MTNELNDELATFFLQDARDYLERFSHLKEKSTDRSRRSKLLVDLLFSLECILKALAFIESKENEKATYKKIRTHDFEKIIQTLTEQSKMKCREHISPGLTEYYVEIRYSLESHIRFRTEEGILGSQYYSTIGDFSWLQKVSENAKALLKYAETQVKTPAIKDVRFCDIDIKKSIERHRRIREIKEANKALEPTIMAVTPPAALASRQP